eukprot:1905700-Pleurochrysis_carterae.AAC.1
MVIGRCRPRRKKRSLEALRNLRLHAIGKHATRLTTRDNRSLRASLRATINSTQRDFRKYRLRQRDAWQRGQDLDADLLLIQKYISSVWGRSERS